MNFEHFLTTVQFLKQNAFLTYSWSWGFSELIHWNNCNSNWKKLLEFRNLQEKLENTFFGHLQTIWYKTGLVLNIPFPNWITKFRSLWPYVDLDCGTFSLTLYTETFSTWYFIDLLLLFYFTLGWKTILLRSYFQEIYL